VTGGGTMIATEQILLVWAFTIMVLVVMMLINDGR
jgi:hypothetical protein